MRTDRITRLAKRLEGIARIDEIRIQREHEIQDLQHRAAVELHQVCTRFVRSLNELLHDVRVDLTPPHYTLDMLVYPGANIFQVNASGRVLQFTFETVDPLISTEHFRTPYILEGAVRWFNRESLESMIIGEHALFYCVEKRSQYWLHFDLQSHRKGAVDEDYLAERFEDLL